MKKIFLIAIAAVLVMRTNAQKTSPDEGRARMMSVEEANRLNGVAEPTINGKPYNQYKAEQEVLKQQRIKEQQQSNTPQGIYTVSATNNPPAEKKTVPAENKYKVTPAQQPKENNMVTKSPSVKPEEKSAASQAFVPTVGSKLYNVETNKTSAGFDPSAKQSTANNTPVVEKPVTDGMNGNPGAKKE